MTGPRARVLASGTQTLGELVSAEDTDDAIEEGRVFVDGRRMEDASARPLPGSTIDIYARRGERPEFRVLARREGLLFVDKPVGIATEPERRGSRSSLVHRVAEELGIPVEGLNALSRLDVGVSGVVVLGLTPEARRRVRAQREERAISRRYVAIASGVPSSERGTWREPIGKSGRGPLRALVPGAQPAVTDYRVTGAVRKDRIAACVLALEPRTGRTHQLRVHASHHGAPLYGDTSYGGPGRIVAANGSVTALARVFLHATWISLPSVGVVESPIPAEFQELWSALGGTAEALAAARVADAALSG